MERNDGCILVDVLILRENFVDQSISAASNGYVNFQPRNDFKSRRILKNLSMDHIQSKQPAFESQTKIISTLIRKAMRTPSFLLATTVALASHLFLLAHGFSSHTTASTLVVGSSSSVSSLSPGESNKKTSRRHRVVLQGFPRGGATFGGNLKTNQKQASSSSPHSTQLQQSKTPYNTESKCPVTGTVAFL